MSRGHDPNDPPPVLLGTDTTTHEHVYLPYDVRTKGVDIVGKPGTGKSSTLEHMILGDLDDGTAGMVIDPHGLLVERVMQYARPEQAKRIILLEADSTAPFGLNLLAVRKASSLEESIAWAADIVVATIKKLYGQSDEFLPRLEYYLDLAVRTLIPSNGTLANVPRLFRNEAFRRQCLRNVTDPDVLDEWEQYDALRKIDQTGQVEAVTNRLNRMLRHPLMQGIFGSHETTVPFDKMFYGDSMLLVSLPAEKLSPERCNFIGALLLSAVADRVFARNLLGESQPRIHLYIDEVQRFATSTTRTLLEEGRKFNVGLTMAHQTIRQIQDAQIRDAARLVGTLIVMGVTRPDADELAGEFPVKPRPERVEKLYEEDGTEPVQVLSPHPAEDVYVDGHDDPDVDLAGRSFFAFMPAAQGDKRKSAGVSPRPGGVKVDKRVQLTASIVQPFIMRAMAGELSTNELLADALLDAGSEQENRSPAAVYFPLVNSSPAIVVGKYCRCPLPKPSDLFDIRFPARGIQRPPRSNPCRCERYDLTDADRAHNEDVKRIFITCVERQLKLFRTWVCRHLEDRAALRAEKRTEALKRADDMFIHSSASDYWDGLWNWGNPLRETSEGVLKPDIRLVLHPAFVSKEFINWQVRKDEQELLDILRERLRWLVILAEGLERDPLWVKTGQQRPRKSPRHIVHAVQTHADALAEFAAKLVDPPERYVAHVRLPDAYHRVKLRPPLEHEQGGGSDYPPDPDPNQPDDIRTRSRALYDASTQQGVVTPLVQPDDPRRGRRVTRRPRPQHDN